MVTVDPRQVHKFFDQLLGDNENLNSSTAVIISSKILIEAGQGVLTIGKSNALDFNEALLHFYDTAFDYYGEVDYVVKYKGQKEKSFPDLIAIYKASLYLSSVFRFKSIPFLIRYSAK